MKFLSELFWWSAVVTGCSQNVTLDIQPNEVLKVYVYDNGSQIQKCDLMSTNAFIDLFKNNPNKWIATPATYAPYILVYGENFQANFIGKKVVINNREGQYIRNIKIQDYIFINCNHK